MRYSLETTHTGTKIQTIVSPSFLNEVGEYEKNLSEYIKIGQKFGTISVENDDDTRLTFDPGRSFLKRSEQAIQSSYDSAYLAFTAISNFATYTDPDPRLIINLSPERLDDGARLGMSAVITWTETRSDAIVAHFVTHHMRSMAKQLRYPWPSADPQLMRGLVGANIDRMRGVSLITNPTGSCALDTDGSDYKPSNPKLEVRAHNLYNTKMQLICAAGAIAFAHFDDLAE